MSFPRKFGLFLAACLCLTNVQELSAQFEVPTQAYLNQFQIVRHWWGTSSIDSSQDRVKFLTLGEKSLYVQSELGTLTTFDAETGERKWVSQIGSNIGSNMRVVELGELLMVSSGMSLYAVQANDGNVRWRASLGFATSASPSGSGAMLYFPTNNGTLYAVDINKLNEMHVKGTLTREAPLAIKWKFITSNPINLSPICTDHYVSFVGADGTVYSVAAANHELRFRFSAGAKLSAPLVMTPKSFIVTADNFHIYNINQATGQVFWQFVSGPKITRSPRVVGEHVFVAPDHGSLFCASLENGEQVWESTGATGFISANDKHVYAYDRLNNLVVLSRETGALEHHVGMQQFNQRLINERTDRTYLSTPAGLIVCLRDQDQVEPLHYLQEAPAEDGKSKQPPAEGTPSSGDEAKPTEGTSEESTPEELESSPAVSE